MSECRYRSIPLHICHDRDGRIPPQELCYSEAAAQLAEQHIAELRERGVIRENPHK